MSTKLCYIDISFIWNIVDSSSNETKEIIKGYVISLMKLKVENLLFPIKTLWQALRQSFWQVFESNLMLIVEWGWLTVCLIKFADS